MKTIILIASLALAGLVSANEIGVVLEARPASENGKVISAGSATGPLGIDGMSLAGQTLSLNFHFGGGHFVRAFTQTGTMTANIDLLLDGKFIFGSFADIPTQLALGTGYFTDINGNRVGNPTDLIGYFGTGGIGLGGLALSSMQIYGQLDPTITQRPLDLYGFNFDVTLPDLLGAAFLEAGHPDSWAPDASPGVGVRAFGPFRRNSVFGLGPKLPADVVPEGGSTIFLLAISLLTIYGRTICCSTERAQK